MSAAVLNTLVSGVVVIVLALLQVGLRRQSRSEHLSTGLKLDLNTIRGQEIHDLVNSHRDELLGQIAKLQAELVVLRQLVAERKDWHP